MVEVYDIDVLEAEEDEDEDEDEDKEADDELSSEKTGGGQAAEVERIGTLVGHTNRSVPSLSNQCLNKRLTRSRVKSISALSHTIPADPPLATTLLSSASSDGFIRVFDLAQVFENTDKAEDNTIEAVGSYDTKGTRLTCCFLADGRKERVVHASSAGSKTAGTGPAPASGGSSMKADDIADMDDADDIGDEDDDDMYDSAQEQDGEEEEEEEEGEEEDEDEMEEEDEDEGEYED